MSKDNIKRRHSKTLNLSPLKRNKLLTRNSFNNGGLFGDYNGEAKGLGWGKASKEALDEAFSLENIPSSLGAVTGAISTMADAFTGNSQIADTSAIENNISETKNTDFTGATDTNSLLDSWNSVNWQDADYTAQDVRGVSTGEMIGNTIGAMGSGVAAGAQLGGPWGAVAGGIAGLGSSLAGIFTGNSKAEQKASELNQAAEKANITARNRFAYQADKVHDNIYSDLVRNISAYGGTLMKDGGKIRIKKKNRGTFTSAAKKHGKSVQAFASQVLANKENYSPAMVKKANFARNASKWKHSLGGFLYDEGGNLYSNVPDSQTHGTEFSNGMTYINAGGTHSENPFDGVQMGVDTQGVPNLVEEGEVIFNDYVFSNRLHPTEDELESVNLPNKYKNSSFAYIAEDLGKESSERPNDPISRRGLEDMMSRLATAQEMQRKKKGKKGAQQLMAYGGRKYAGDSDLNNLYNDPYIGSKEQALEEAELNYYASKSPEIQEELEKIRGNDSTLTSLPTYLRYAPAIGSAIGALQSALATPDYENADILMAEANSLPNPRVSFRPIGDYLTYRPLDRNYYLNQLRGQAGATRRAIMNSGANTGSAMAGLLAADYNAQNAIGNTLMQMQQYNDAQRQKTAEFNRGTDQFNSQGLYTADAANAQLAADRSRLRASLLSNAAQMRENADAQLEASRSANMTNFFDNLGGIGTENFIMNQIASNPSLYYQYTAPGKGTVGFKGKNGGMLTKKNRRRK